MMTNKEIIAVVQAREAGRPIEEAPLWCDVWVPATPRWNFETHKYRVKPEPMECWMNVYPNGLRTYFSSEAEANHSSKEKAEQYRIGHGFVRCVHMVEVME